MILPFNRNEWNSQQHIRTVHAEPTSVAIFVGGVFVGYVFAVVVDGTIIAISGYSAAEHYSHLVQSLIGTKYTAYRYFPGTPHGYKDKGGVGGNNIGDLEYNY